MIERLNKAYNKYGKNKEINNGDNSVIKKNLLFAFE